MIRDGLRGFGISVVLAASSVVGCSSDNRLAACERGSLFSTARARAERAVTELDRTTTIELRESVTAIADQVQLLREVSPRALRDPLGVLLAAYGQLVVTLDDISWDPLAARTDAAVAGARAAFAETDVSQATRKVETFFADQCQVALDSVNPLFAVTGTTLPMPETGEEARPEADEDSAPSAGELQAIGFLIGETYGVALTEGDAECVARALGTRFADVRDFDVSDDQYFGLVAASFSTCGVRTPPSTAVEN